MKKAMDATTLRHLQDGLPSRRQKDKAGTFGHTGTEPPAAGGTACGPGGHTFIQISEQTVWDVSIVDADGEVHTVFGSGSMGAIPGSGSPLHTTIRILECALATLRKQAGDRYISTPNPVR